MTFSRRTIVTSWNTYIPIFNTTNGDGSAGDAVLVGKWRRLGDSVEIVIRFSWQSTTSGGTGEFILSIPPGMTINASKLVETFPSEIFGSTSYLDNSTAASRTSGSIKAHNSTNMKAVPEGFTTTTATTPFTWATSDLWVINAILPIVEFS